MMSTVARHLGVALTLMLFASASGQVAQASGEGPQVAKWKTWVLTSAAEIGVPAPPGNDSTQTKAELEQLRQLQALRSPLLNRAADHWNNGPATQRWTETTFALMRQAGLNPIRQFRVLAHVHAAMHDAVVASYHAKYAHNRTPPNALATDLILSTVVNGEPSYPSEHAAVAGAAAGVLAAFFPKESALLAAMAQEAGQARLVAGANYPSDVEAGLRLGQAVAEKVNLRAASDGADAVWTGTVPTGDGLWTGTPAEPLAGTWKTWLLTSNDQVRPAPPPAFGSAEFLAELAEVKRINMGPTASERAIALYWGTNLYLPFWEAAAALIAREKLSTPRAARLTAALGTAVADSIIAVWDAKFHYWLLRPSQADATIVPLIPNPPYPAYPGGVAGVVGSLGDVLAHFFAQEAQRLRYMEEEASMSRLYAGIHYRSDNDAGLVLGRRVAELAIQRDRLNEN